MRYDNWKNLITPALPAPQPLPLELHRHAFPNSSQHQRLDFARVDRLIQGSSAFSAAERGGWATLHKQGNRDIHTQEKNRVATLRATTTAPGEGGRRIVLQGSTPKLPPRCEWGVWPGQIIDNKHQKRTQIQTPPPPPYAKIRSRSPVHLPIVGFCGAPETGPSRACRQTLMWRLTTHCRSSRHMKAGW